MFQLEEKKYFYALVIIPIYLLVTIALYLWKKNKQKQFASTLMLEKLAPDISRFKMVFKIVLWCFVFLFLVIALVNPKIGTKLETVKREGVDIVFALDVSKSMLAKDIAPNRLEKSKRVVSEIIANLAGDRIGIIAYAGQAFPQLPITTDYAAARMFLQSMNTDMLSSQGTAIEQAITLSKNYFDDKEQTNRILIILSDGENHSKDVLDAVADATEQGIKIYTIGVGSEKGAPIPIVQRNVVSYKRDKDGGVVVTRLDPDILQQIAAKGNGAYIHATNTKKTVSFIKQALSKVDKKEFEAKQITSFKDQFQWFVAAALVLLLLDVFVLEKKTTWIQNLNLFNDKK